MIGGGHCQFDVASNDICKKKSAMVDVGPTCKQSAHDIHFPVLLNKLSKPTPPPRPVPSGGSAAHGAVGGGAREASPPAHRILHVLAPLNAKGTEQRWSTSLSLTPSSSISA
jgi:hypothetical protein